MFVETSPPHAGDACGQMWLDRIDVAATRFLHTGGHLGMVISARIWYTVLVSRWDSPILRDRAKSRSHDDRRLRDKHYFLHRRKTVSEAATKDSDNGQKKRGIRILFTRPLTSSDRRGHRVLLAGAWPPHGGIQVYIVRPAASAVRRGWRHKSRSADQRIRRWIRISCSAARVRAQSSATPAVA